MKNKLLNGQHLSINEQVDLLSEFVVTIEGMPKILEKISNLPNAWVGAGIIFQNVWNVIHGYELNTHIKDIDILTHSCDRIVLIYLKSKINSIISLQ